MSSGNSKNIHSGHRSRVREKIKNGALDNMNYHEILEYLLFHTVAYKDTNELAHRIIDYFGSFHGVFDATFDDLMQVEGVTEVTAVFLSSLKTIFVKYSEDLNHTTKIVDANDVAGFIKAKFFGATVEKVYMICLDGKMNVLKCEIIGEGDSCEVMVDNRKVAEIAIRSNAENVIIAHNHPNNVANPSSDDIEATYSLRKMLRTIDINLLDSVIVTNNSCVSLLSNK